MGIRKLPLVVALGVILGVALFYAVFYKKQLAYILGRDARLLLVAERGLTSAAEGGPETRRRREGRKLVVEVDRQAPWPEWKTPVSYRVDLAQVLEQVPLGREAFDSLLVADAAGTVVAQTGDLTLSRFSLEGLGEPAVGPEALWKGNATVRLAINGGDYRMFCRPVRLPHATAEGATVAGFIFCGLVAEARLVQEALSVSPHVVAAIVVVLALTFLTPPFIKLVVLRPSERFRFSDAYSLALCTFLGLLILTIAIVDVSLVRRLQARGDDALEALARGVARSIHDELDAMQAQVARFDESVAPSGGPAALCEDVLGLRGSPRGEGCPALDVSMLSYPNLESVAWVRADGEQSLKWYGGPVRDESRGRFKVHEREYFRGVREGRLWFDEHPQPDRRAAAPRLVQAVRTWSSGQTRAVLAMPSAAASAAHPEAPVVVTATASLASVTDPVLPPSTGFAVIDRDGAILFHSDGRQALTHNLFEENEDDFDLRSAVAARVADRTEGRYWGRRHRFQVLPLEGTPWSVVAFRDEGLLRAFHVEVLESVGGLVLLYVTLGFALPSLLLVLGLRRRVPWLWPTEQRGLVYLQASFSLAAVAVLLAAGVRRAEPDQAVALAFAAPWAILAALVTCFALGAREWPQRLAAAVAALGSMALAWWSALAPAPGHAGVFILRSAALSVVIVAVFDLAAVQRACSLWESALQRVTREHFLVPHLALSLLFWLVYAVLPGVTFMKAVADAQLRILARHEQLTYAGGFERRLRAAGLYYGTPVPRPRPGFLERWTASRPGVYLAGLFDTTPYAERTPAPSRPTWPRRTGRVAHALDRMIAHKPLLDRAGAAWRHLGFPSLTRAEWWAPDPAGGRREYVSLRLGADEPSLRLESRVPAFWSAVGPWPGLALLALVPPLVFWIRWSARHIFLAGVDAPLAVDLEAVKEELRANSICLVPSSVEIERVAQGDWCERLAPGAASAPAEGARTVVVVPDLDLATLAAADRQGLLAILERLAQGPRRVCILASSHPTDFLIGPAASPPAELGFTARETDRWVRLLSGFAVVLLRERRRKGRDGTVDAAVVGARALGLSPSPAPRSAEYEWLVRELDACPHLAELASQRLEEGSLARRGRDEMTRRLADLAWPYYWGLWAACPPEDRLTLVQLSEEHFVNPRRQASVRRLLQKGIVAKDPMPRPMNESFALFIRTIRRSEQIAAWERTEDGFGWADLKMPLGALAVSCAVVLFVAHKDLLDSTMVFVSALGVSGVPALAKLASAVNTIAQVAGNSAGRARV